MEDNVDIYADLPSFSLNSEKNIKDEDCNCDELKKELNSLVSKFENVQRIKTNLEKNMSSLLKTAKAEIARKDKMIAELRKQLDNIIFRKGSKNKTPVSSTHRLPHQYIETRNYENVPSIHSHESKTELHQAQFHCEYKSNKSQTDVNRISTLFGERLQKRIAENEKEEEKQKALNFPNVPKNNGVEIYKENESLFSIHNNNESNIGRCSNSEFPERNSHGKNLMKRISEEDDTRTHKCLKIKTNEDITATEEIDYNYLIRYDLTDDHAQYEMKNSKIKFEDQSSAVYSFKREEISFCTGHRAASEYRDTKRDQSYTNGWKNDAKNISMRNHDSSNVRNDLADSLRNPRITSTLKYVSKGFKSGYKKNGYRYSPSRRSHSRSRSDYESLSSHRLGERFSRTYREKKYNDYKYDSRYKNERLKRNYESEESDGKTRYRRGRGVLRDRSRYSSSDAEDRESSISHKKYENRRIKKETVSLNDKKLHESNKTAAKVNFRESSSRTIVDNTTNYTAEKNIKQHKVKDESEIKSKNSTESTSAVSAHVAMKNLNILEEGEVLDSPKKTNNSAKISKNNKMEENDVESIIVENKNEDISVNISIDDKSISFQNNVCTKQLEVVDINTKKIEATCLLQENLKDCEKVIQLSSDKSDMAVDEVYYCKKDEDTCKSYINEAMDSTAQNIGTIEQVHDNDIDDKNDTVKTLKDFITKTAITESAKIKEISSNSVTKIKEIDDSNINNVKKEEMDNPNVEITKMNNFNSNSIHQIDSDESRTSTAKIITKVKAVLNCDTEDKDKSQAPIECETFQMSDKSNVEMCLNDHNYVQKPFIKFHPSVSDLDESQKLFLRSKCEVIRETTMSKETKAEKTINVQSVKRTSSIVKNKKDQQSKGILISHRRKAVKLSDSNASMTVLMNTNIVKMSSVMNKCNDNDSILKPRACKISRVIAKVTCK